MTRVAAMDSSMQSTMALVVDADSGDLLEQASDARRDGTEVERPGRMHGVEVGR